VESGVLLQHDKSFHRNLNSLVAALNYCTAELCKVRNLEQEIPTRYGFSIRKPQHQRRLFAHYIQFGGGALRWSAPERFDFSPLAPLVALTQSSGKILA
jgi:hypothetical protein